MSTGPINFRPAVQPPPPPPPPEVTAFRPLPAHEQVGQAGGLPTQDRILPANLPADASAVGPAVIAPPPTPSLPIGAPSTAKSAPAEQIIALAERLLGKPLSDQVKQQVTMEAGLMPTSQVVKNLLTNPGVASSIAQRAVGLAKEGKFSGFMKSFMSDKSAVIKAGIGLLKPGGFMEKIKNLKDAFKVTTLSSIKVPFLSSLFGSKKAPEAPPPAPAPQQAAS